LQKRFYHISKRLFDVIVSFVFLILLLPLFLIIAIAIKADSKGSVFYLQKRVGKDFREFRMFKFRTMKPGSDKGGLLTIGRDDQRITAAGKSLRRYKLDELPQLINVFTGQMSLVGPRPEVKKYVDLYNNEQKKVISIKPGITDLVSIRFFNENEIISRYANPEEGYIKEVMPEKLRLNLEYIRNQNFFSDLGILFKTLKRIFSPTSKNSSSNEFEDGSI
jgi:lipopolysaccharide/colanic/teichoic acid biosynthesis glycosyltransferase